MGRFIDFLTSSAIAQITAWATEHMATLRRVGCADPDPVKAARRFADYCIRNGIDQDDDDRARREPVGYYRVGEGLWRPAAIQGKTKAPDPKKLRAWMDWRQDLVFKAVREDHRAGMREMLRN
jgi:hypothetical protein